MKIEREFYTSYSTHNYCTTCSKWIRKEETPGVYCPICNIKLRKRSRYGKNKVVKRY